MGLRWLYRRQVSPCFLPIIWLETERPCGAFFMRISGQPLWTPLASSALAGAWLAPNIQPPWNAFHKDAYLALVLAVVCYPVLVQVWKQRIQSRCDWLSIYLVGLALLVMVQWATGKTDFLGRAFVGAAYFLAAGFAMYIGRVWTAWSRGHVERFLLGAFLVAGVSSAGIIYGQWAQIDLHPIWFSYLPPGERPFGNLNQANNAGSLLLLGLISLAWLMLIGRVRVSLFLPTAGFLVGAIVLTASRITFASLCLILIFASISAWRLKEFRAYRWLPLALFLIFSTFFLAQQFGWEQGVADSNPLKRDLVGVRMAAYSAFGEALLRGPMMGFGFDQAVKAQLLAGEFGHQLPGIFGSTHNFVLDIGIWFGWPVALVGVIVGLWSVCQLRYLRIDVTSAASMACVLVLLAHGMVELPLAYAYFLLPFCMLWGALLARANAPAMRLSAPIAGAWILSLSLGLATLWLDYLRVEEAFSTWRFKVSRVGKAPEKIELDVLLLDQFVVLINGLETDPAKSDQVDLEKFQSAVLSFPSPLALQKLVLLRAMRGDIRATEKNIKMARTLVTAQTNQAMAAQWKSLQKAYPNVAKIEWKPN